MSILNAIKTKTHRVVSFHDGALSFMVRPISSVDLAANDIAGLMAVAGKRNDPDRTSINARMIRAAPVLQAEHIWRGWNAEDEATRGQEPERPSPEDLAMAVDASVQQHAYAAMMVGPEKARALAMDRQGMACAGVIQVKQGDGDWQPCRLSAEDPSSETDDGVVLNVLDVSTYIEAIAKAVHGASTKEAAKVVATFPEKPGDAEPA